jgi:hypothetical protein
MLRPNGQAGGSDPGVGADEDTGLVERFDILQGLGQRGWVEFGLGIALHLGNVLGHMAVMLAKAMGATVTAITTKEEKRALAFRPEPTANSVAAAPPQWRSVEDFEAMMKNPAAKPHMEQVAAIAKFEPALYEVVESYAVASGES